MSQQPYYAANGSSVIVQGTIVTQPQEDGGFVQGFNQGSVPSNTYNHGVQQPQSMVMPMQQPQEENWTKGQPQPKRCNDMLFGILFYAHLGAMAWCAATYGPVMMATLTEDSSTGQNANGRRYLSRILEESNADDVSGAINVDDVNDVILLLGVSGVAGFILSSLALGFMSLFAECLIKTALAFNIISFVLLAFMMLAAGAIPVGIMALLGVGFTAYYSYCVWARIPFAAANMKTAITAVRANFGVVFFSYLSLVIIFLWSIWWSIATLSATFVISGCNAAGECQSETSGIIIFLFMVSFFWTVQVARNVVHVTVAGTVGTWWFDPLTASSCCSRGVRDSWFRAMTFSFGSICFGSLIVAVIQAFKEMVHQMREQDDGILACCAECLLGCIESLVEYFNAWAFTYVGLYGYSFMEAGKNVMTLFRSKGWTTIVTDNLVDSALGMVSIGMGVLTGVTALFLASVTGMDLAIAIPFCIGFVIGLALCSTLFSVVSSAVNTVVVCYAEAPNEFQANHPLLSENMRDAWRKAWPSEFHY
jgi:hypothetical protein